MSGTISKQMLTSTHIKKTSNLQICVSDRDGDITLTCQHRQCGCLSSSVVTQQDCDLTFIHIKCKTSHCLFVRLAHSEHLWHDNPHVTTSSSHWPHSKGILWNNVKSGSCSTFVKCLSLTPDTSPTGSSSINSPFRAFSASSSSSFSFRKATRGLLHQYDDCGGADQEAKYYYTKPIQTLISVWL